MCILFCRRPLELLCEHSKLSFLSFSFPDSVEVCPSALFEGTTIYLFPVGGFDLFQVCELIAGEWEEALFYLFVSENGPRETAVFSVLPGLKNRAFMFNEI